MEAAVDRALKRAGHKTFLFDDRRWKRRIGRTLTQRLLVRRAREFAPEFVFLSKCQALELDTVSAVINGIPNAMWYHDALWYRHVDRLAVGHSVAVGRLAQTFFITGFEKEWAKHGLRTKWLPSAADQSIKPVAYDPVFASTVAFIGSGYDPDRARLLIDVAEKHAVRVWGPDWEKWKDQVNWTGRSVEGEEFAAVCSSSQIMLGINPTAGSNGNFISDRLWMVILAGAFHLGQRSPGIDRILLEGEHVGWYDDVKSCIAQCDYYLANSEKREQMRGAAREYVLQNHTYDQRIHNLLEDREFVVPN